MVKESADMAKKALIIAIRYGLIRRQFSSTPNEQETKILDYGTHQMRLIPLLAATFAMTFCAQEVGKIYDHLMARMERITPNDPDIQKIIESLKETHATSAGLKAYCTWFALNLIEQCRQSVGGLGYSSYVGLSTMYQDFAVQCTWEVNLFYLGR
jgi:acyl-CoA oxidase